MGFVYPQTVHLPLASYVQFCVSVCLSPQLQERVWECVPLLLEDQAVQLP